MTNLNFKRFTGVALLLLGISACNKEVSEPQGSGSSQSVQAKTEQMYLEVITNSSEEMRLAQKVDGTGATNGVFMNEKDLAIQIAVRRKGQVNFTSQLLRFEKIKGVPRARYTGLVDVPAGSGNEIEIAGVVLSEWTGSGAAPLVNDQKFMTKESGDFFRTIKANALQRVNDGVVQTKIPYIVNWTTARLTAEGSKQRIEPVELQFRPSGTILRMQVRNALGEEVTISRINVKTNAFVEQWQYNFTNGLVQENTLMGGEVVSPTALPLAMQYYSWGLGLQPITLTSTVKDSEWLYIWVMGTKSFNGRRKIEFSVQTESGKTYDSVFKTSAELKDGQTMSVPLELSSSKLGGSFGSSTDTELSTPFESPLSFIATTGSPNYHAKVASGTAPGAFELVAPTEATVGYYTAIDAANYFGQSAGVSIKNEYDKYRLPNIWELGSIFPTQIEEQSVLDSYSYSGTNTRIVRERVQFIGESSISTITSRYKSGSDGALYAIRFEDFEQKRTAFRYQWSDGYLTVTTRYIGDKPLENSIDVVANPRYWQRPLDSDVKIAIRTLGYKTRPDGGVNDLDKHGGFWSATQRDSDSHRRVNFSANSLNGFDFFASTRILLPVLLIPVD